MTYTLTALIVAAVMGTVAGFATGVGWMYREANKRMRLFFERLDRELKAIPDSTEVRVQLIKRMHAHEPLG